MELDEYLRSNNGGATEDEMDLSKVISSFNQQQPTDDESEPEVAETDDANEGKEKPAEEAPQEKPKPADVKPPEQPEVDQNAINAERRRQREATIAQKALESSQEVQLVKMISELTGKTVEQLQAEFRVAKVAKELASQGMTDEQIEIAAPKIANERQQAEATQAKTQQLEQENVQLQYQQWVGKIEADKAKILSDHPYLSNVDIDQAMDYMLNTLQNPHIPLEQVVNALHVSKIIEGKQAVMRTELLAEMSGRKAAPLPPQGSPSKPDTNVLTADEKFIAKKMGMTEAEYMKWK